MVQTVDRRSTFTDTTPYSMGNSVMGARFKTYTVEVVLQFDFLELLFAHQERDNTNRTLYHIHTTQISYTLGNNTNNTQII